MMPTRQVDKSHYGFSAYVDKRRWSSLWHQLDEVCKLEPGRTLEIGPGPGLFKAAAMALGLKVETLDIDPELKPDHVGSVYEMAFEDAEFDVVCAFQVLEHLPFEKSLAALKEMSRVAGRAVVISLPDARKRWPVSFQAPFLGSVCFSIPKPRLYAPRHRFDGQHYWEIGKAGFALNEVSDVLARAAQKRLTRTFRVPDNPYHRFFVFSP